MLTKKEQETLIKEADKIKIYAGNIKDLFYDSRAVKRNLKEIKNSIKAIDNAL